MQQATYEDIADDRVDGSFAVMLSSAVVEVKSYHIDQAMHNVTLDLTVRFANSFPVGRVLTLSAIGNGNTRGRLVAKLENENGNLKWEMGFERDIMDEDYLVVYEKTTLDELIIEQFIRDSSFVEIYTLNGDKKEFSFPTTDANLIKAVGHNTEMMEGSTDIKVSNGSVTELQIARTVQEFRNWYDDNNSLHSNLEGQLVGEFLTSTQVSNWLGKIGNVSIDGSNANPAVYRWPWKVICVMAVRCVMMKCEFGGIYNPVCLGCGITVLVCVIAAVVGVL